MESNSTAILIKIKLRHSLGRPSRSDFVQSRFVCEKPINKRMLIFIALASTNSFYLDWNYNDPELAVAGTILHGFEFLFVRLAPIVFLTSVVGVVVTYKKR